MVINVINIPTQEDFCFCIVYLIVLYNYSFALKVQPTYCNVFVIAMIFLAITTEQKNYAKFHGIYVLYVFIYTSCSNWFLKNIPFMIVNQWRYIYIKHILGGYINVTSNFLKDAVLFVFLNLMLGSLIQPYP